MATENNKVLITLFGATGDLAKRKLYPALFRLYRRNIIKDHFAIIGTARREWSDDYYRTIIAESIKDLTDDWQEATQFASHFYYVSHNVNDTQHYINLLSLVDKLDEKYAIGGNRIFYLSMSPNYFGIIAKHLKEQGFVDRNNGYNHLIIEKPFGTDYETAAELNQNLSESFTEDQIYRIDHYLGKFLVQNILTSRMTNPFLDRLLNNENVREIQITLAEDLGVEERGGYYDTSGVMRDMVQNHLLQVMTLLTMDLPEANEPEKIREEKIKLLNSVNLFDAESVKESIIRGQYGSDWAGKVAYRDEKEVDPNSMTETYIAGKFSINNPRWQGVPIFFRSGKAMAKKMTSVHVVFKNAADTGIHNVHNNVLSFYIQPELGTQFRMNGVSSAGNDLVSQYRLTHDLQPFSHQFPEAYEQLLQDSIEANNTNFTHWDEVAQSWRIVDSIRAGWEANGNPDFPNYEVGSMGPFAADNLLNSYHSSWID